MEEVVDIVNQQGQVTGQIAKNQAHVTGDLHPCVVGQFIDDSGKWILVKQASDRQDAGQFVSPVGGHVQSGESSDQAIRREALEEMGLTNIQFRKIGSAIFNRDVIGRRENHLFVLYEIHSKEAITLNHESVAFEQFSRAELSRQLITTPQKFGDSFHFVVKHFYPDLLAAKK